MRKQTLIPGVAALISAASLIFLYLYFNPSPPAPDLQPHEGLGEVLAQEAVRSLGSGGKLYVFTRETKTFRMPVVEAQMAAFERALDKARVPVTVTRRAAVNPLRVVTAPSGDIFDTLRKCSDQDVIVSFLGPPVLSPKQLSGLGAARPKIIAVCSGAMPGQIDLKEIFSRKLLHTAIIHRSDPVLQPASGETPSAAFARLFKKIDVASVVELPSSAR